MGTRRDVHGDWGSFGGGEELNIEGFVLCAFSCFKEESHNVEQASFKLKTLLPQPLMLAL